MARPVMAVASEPAAKYPKVAAPTTGPIPAAELLGVIQEAAKAGADVRFASPSCFPSTPVPGLPSRSRRRLVGVPGSAFKACN
jgi:hypothetical protein